MKVCEASRRGHRADFVVTLAPGEPPPRPKMIFRWACCVFVANVSALLC